MENRGLIFIPDISGFTQFVNETEIDHSRLILQELLEILINANRIDLEISEIEGDAILFYKFGSPPTIDELYAQVANMFCAFHKCLLAYESYKYCQCKACTSAIGLTLKIITHYGEFTQYQVKDFRKLIGKDLIIAHRLLKNEINPREYWLITTSLTERATERLPATLDWKRQAIQTESGEVNYYYSQLSVLKEKLRADAIEITDRRKLRKVLSLSKVYDTDIITLFHATGDFNHRHRWRMGVKKVEEVNHFLPRVGMKCRYVGADGEKYIYSSSYRYDGDRIEFTETEEITNVMMEYVLIKIDDHHTSLTIDYYIPRNVMATLLFSMHRRKSIEHEMMESMNALTFLVAELKIPSVSA